MKLNPRRNYLHEQTYTDTVTFNCLLYGARGKRVENIMKLFKTNIITYFENFISSYVVRFLLQVTYFDFLFYRLSDTEEKQP